MLIKTSNDIGGLIRDRRSGLGWTQEELARRVGVSRLWVVQLEKGKPTAQIGLALRALKELGVTLDASSTTSTSSDQTADPMIDLNRVIRGTLPPKS
jgi:HTH-type transcriptional regulator/antitoxin HipB